jgi:hypothetical protein
MFQCLLQHFKSTVERVQFFDQRSDFFADSFHIILELVGKLE